MDIIKAIWLVIWCSRALYGQYGMKEIWGLSRMWYVEHSQNRLKSFFLRSLPVVGIIAASLSDFLDS